MRQSGSLQHHIVLIGGLLMATSLAGCGKSNSYKAPPAPPVTTSKPVQMPMTTYLQVTGNTVAINSVNLVARVSGYLTSVDYTDGAIVPKGKTLFVIEQPPYAAKLQQATAAVAQAKAQVTYAQSQYDRQLDMIKQNATSTANVEQWLAQRDSAQAQVIEAIANEELAKINYGYTTVSAPFDGKVSRHLVDPGNLVGNGVATQLATIDQLAPIYVYFNVNEAEALTIRAAVMKMGRQLGETTGEPVQIGLQTETGFPHQGKVDYVSPSLDPSTGTIQARAIFTNADEVLLPGLFVRVQIPLGAPTEQMALPQAAVQSDQGGSYVYVVGANNVVAQKSVTTGVVNGSMIAVTGLAPDDKVIVDGVQNAAAGITVAPTEQDLTAPAPSPGLTANPG
jgi:RND family efflux transporter MFP subunit